MVFYQDNNELVRVDESPPDEDTAYLLVNEFTNLKNLDIKNFNYYMFIEDIERMTPDEFEWWYTHAFRDWVSNIDESYLYLDFDTLDSSFNKTSEKKLFLSKLVHFVMFFLPYQIIRDLIKLKMSSDIQTFINLLNDSKTDANLLIALRTDMVEIIDSNMIQLDDFVSALGKFEKVAKKNITESSVEKLDKYVEKQNFFMSIFKEIIINSDMENVRDLLFEFIKNDKANII